MKVNTSRFGHLEVSDRDFISFPEGLLGFQNLKKFFITDPADETFILWLQSVEDPHIAFPILEPKIFRSDYAVRLSANELRLLQLDSLSQKDILVFSVITIPADPKQMTANLKAPIVINAEKQVGRQVVLQENAYSIKCAMYKELMAAIMIASKAMAQEEKAPEAVALSLVRASSNVEVSAL